MERTTAPAGIGARDMTMPWRQLLHQNEAKTHREVLAICFEAPSAGLVVVSAPTEGAESRRGSGSVQLRYANGTLLRAFSAEDPDALRGYAFDGVWGDEYAAWRRRPRRRCTTWRGSACASSRIRGW